MIAVIGSGTAGTRLRQYAEQTGAAIARQGFGLLTGGLGGVMEAACKGARSVVGDQSGRIVAILPGTEKEAANDYADIVLPTGLGHARNLIIVLGADAVIAVGGESGTLSEIAHAWQAGKPICALASADGWAAKLAGTLIDNKYDRPIAVAESVVEIEAWLDRLPDLSP